MHFRRRFVVPEFAARDRCGYCVRFIVRVGKLAGRKASFEESGIDGLLRNRNVPKDGLGVDTKLLTEVAIQRELQIEPTVTRRKVNFDRILR